jgi:acetate kinase
VTLDDVLVVNVGSSTVKVQVVSADGRRTFDEELPAGADPDELAGVLDAAGPAGAVGHRLVHGGSEHVEPELVTDELLAALEELVPLAPLHLPPALAVLRQVLDLRPAVPAVACYDTAFHATIPPAAHLYALPAAWEDELGARRFGFHGLSHRYVSQRTAQLVGRRVEDLKVITCHLGAGASLAAVDGGRCVDTTMGFTPLAGLVMATRSGDVDPGLVLWLQREAGIDAASVEDELWHGSGLAGLSRRSGDLREVMDGVEDGDERCRLALDVYVHRLRGEIARMGASLGGIDAVAFTGGVGERSASVRAAAIGGLGFLGLSLDAVANESVGDEDADVTGPAASALTLVVHTREDLEIARQVRTVVPEPST